MEVAHHNFIFILFPVCCRQKVKVSQQVSEEVSYLFIYFGFCSCRKGPSVQAEEADHVPAVEHHVRRPHPPRPHHARDGEGPDGRAEVRDHGGSGLSGDTVQEGERQAGDLG